MAMQLGHVHIKTREDPQKVAKFYIDPPKSEVRSRLAAGGNRIRTLGPTRPL